MTRPYERSRSVVQTREFLKALQRDQTVPPPIRHEARRLLRHYPDASDVQRAAEQELWEPRRVLEPVFGSLETGLDFYELEAIRS